MSLTSGVDDLAAEVTQVKADATAAMTMRVGMTTAAPSGGTVPVDLGDTVRVCHVPAGIVGLAADTAVMVTLDANTAVVAAVLSASATSDLETRIRVAAPRWWLAAIPSGALECNGQAISSSTYPILASVYGANLPDLRGVFPLGVSGTYALNSTGGAATKTLSTAEMPAHTHDLGGHTHTVSNIGIGTVQEGTGGSANVYYPSGANSTTSGPSTASGSAGSGSSFSILPPYRAGYWIVIGA